MNLAHAAKRLDRVHAVHENLSLQRRVVRERVQSFILVRYLCGDVLILSIVPALVLPIVPSSQFVTYLEVFLSSLGPARRKVEMMLA